MYALSVLPTGREPGSSQFALMTDTWTQTDVTKPSTTGKVGLFGYEREDGDDCPWIECEDEYYFYMTFVPFDDIRSTSNAVFRMWF